jgi:hypothetical protein
LVEIVEKGSFLFADKSIIKTRQQQIMRSFPYKIKPNKDLIKSLKQINFKT